MFLSILGWTLQAGAAAAAPVITVQQAATGVTVARSSTYVFPDVGAGVSESVLFTINNTGNVALVISNPAALVSGTAWFEIANAPSSIAAGGSGTFRVRLLSGSAGTYTGTVSIQSNDPVTPTFTFFLRGTVLPPPAPKIGVLLGSTPMANDPMASFYTFPNGTTGLAQHVIFTIVNNGTADLVISNPTTLVSGTGFAETVSPPATIPAGGSGNFWIRLLSGTAGSFAGLVSISSNDATNSPYVFRVLGNVLPPAAPKIGVQQGTTALGYAGVYDYTPDETVGVSDSRLFTITNTGNADLVLSNSATLVSGTGWSEVATPPTTIPAGGSGTFRVRILSNAAGTFVGTVTIQSNDPLNGSFYFYVRATVDPPPAPKIGVAQGATAIAAGSTFAFPAETVNVADSRVFTITNTGNATLTIANPAALVSGSGWSETASAPASIAPGASGSFTLRILSATAGTYTGTVTISSNDPAAGTFTFSVRATVNPPAIPKIGVQQGSTVVAAGSTFLFPAETTNVADSRVFTISNTGTATLTIANPAALVSGTGWSETASAPASVAAGASGSFTLRILSATAGTFNGTVTIQSSDPNTPAFTFTVRATVNPPPAPHLAVMADMDAISNHGTYALPTLDTVSSYTTTVFVSNTGNATLTLTNGSSLVSGAGFTQVSTPAASIAPGAGTSFQVRFQGGQVGSYHGVVTIQSNDAASQPFTFGVDVTVVAPTPALSVTQGANYVTLNQVVAYPDGTAGVSQSLLFTILNTGNGTLHISNPAALVSGAGFSEIENAPATIAPGASATFRVRLLAASAGTYTGSVSILSDDPYHSNFAFGLSGRVNPAYPTIGVLQGSTPIAEFSTFLYTPPMAVGVATTRTFTITNTGPGTLNVGNPAALLTAAPGFYEAQNAPASIPPGGSGTFAVQLLSMDPGTFATTVTIQSDDPSNGSFIFYVQGTVAPPDFSLSVSPASQSLAPGGSTTYTVSAAGVYGFTSGIALSLSGLPAGASYSFQPGTVTPGGSSTLQVRTTGATPAGSSHLTITGTGGGLTRTATATLNVSSPDFSLAVSPPSQQVVVGQGTAYTVTVSGAAGFTSTVALSASGLPTGTTASFDPPSVGPGGSSTLTLQTSTLTPTGGASFTVSAVGGGHTHSTTAALDVQVPPPAGAPVVAGVSPSFFRNGKVTLVTLTGQNFQGASVSVPTAPPPGTDPGPRVFPSAQVQSISADGTSMTVAVDATDTRTLDFYNLVVANVQGSQAAQVRVIPQGPLVDLYSPGSPEQGAVYVLSIIGHNLAGATVTASPAGAVQILDVDNSQEDHLTGLLQVADDAPLGTVNLVVSGAVGSPATLPIQVVAGGASLRRAHRLLVKPLAQSGGGAMKMPNLFFQDFAVRRPEETEIGADGGVHIVSRPDRPHLAERAVDFTLYVNYTIDLIQFRYQRVFLFDPATGKIGDTVLQGLGLGQQARTGAFVLSFFFDASVTVYFGYDFDTGFTFPLACLRLTAADEIPGLNGFYEEIDFCLGGFGASYNSAGSTSTLQMSGGPCATVAQDGPPVEGIAMATVTQQQCCPQPIGATASGDTFAGASFGGSFDVTTPIAGMSTPDASCSCGVTISPAPACIGQGHTAIYSALGSPANGTYAWRITGGGSKAAIMGAANQSLVTIAGNATSSAADDVTLTVDYTVGNATCSQQARLSVVSAQLSFSDSGQLDSLFARRSSLPSHGFPTLGAITPGNPAGATGFFQNMQIKAAIQPCDAALRCSYDFKRLRQGAAGFYNPTTNLFSPLNVDCPAGGCDDDNSNTDEDLMADPPPDCSIFVWDSPGAETGVPPTCSSPGLDLIVCLNFNEWLQIDGARGTDDLLWTASTRLTCNGTTWQLDPSGGGNTISLGTSAACNSRRSLPVGIRSAPSVDLEAGQVAAWLYSSLLEDRARAGRAIADSARSTAQQRRSLVPILLAAAEVRQTSYPFEATPLVAIRLLGELRVHEAIPILLDRTMDSFPRVVATDMDTLSAAGAALVEIGQPAIEPILGRSAAASDEEWKVLRRVLGEMKAQPAVRRAASRRLSERLETRERLRLQALLDEPGGG